MYYTAYSIQRKPILHNLQESRQRLEEALFDYIQDSNSQGKEEKRRIFNT
jgi:hypothetical protein